MLFVVVLLDTQSREERNETQPMFCAGWILIQSASTASSRGRERDTQGLVRMGGTGMIGKYFAGAEREREHCATVSGGEPARSIPGAMYTYKRGGRWGRDTV